jgi:hypothetical protein
MRRQPFRILATATVLLSLLQLLPYCLGDNYSTSYELLDHPSGSTHYRLNVVISQSLQEYYLAKSHSLSSAGEFDKFVTPYALQPIADSLRQIYTDDEDFTNGALMIVHQIPYEQTTLPLYPVETMVDNKGDCDLFSFIAASIIKAGGLDVVLLYYEQEAHMNIGVSLPSQPRNARGDIIYVTNNNIKYYMAECTGGNWQDGWRVGECPDELRDASAQIILLDGYEQTSTGQVSTSFASLAAATLTLTSSTAYIIQGNTVTLSGHLSPSMQDKTVTFYVRVNNSPWQVLGTVTTDTSGHFDYTWNMEAGGIWHVRASWSGDDYYAAADSPIRTITSLSSFFVMLMAITVILVVIGTIAYVAARRNNQSIPEPQPPEIPYYP